MKALINILSRLLLLLLLATACAPVLDTEVPLMGKDEVLLTVNMQVPGLKVSTRAGEALTDIKALCFNESGGLEKIETATEVTALTFKIYVPKETRKIHFLANLPKNYSLGGVMTESDLTELTTTDKSSLSYWGMATFDGTNKSIPQVNFYRNMAMITIAPGEDAVFGQNQLSIAGVVNGYNTGKLVPNREVNQNVSFDFNLSNGYDYYSLPTTYNLTDDAEDKQYGATAYVFEHPNEPNTLLDALHVICKIGDNYYKVALAYEDQQGEYQNYSIIRNHKYVIYVSDVCDVPQERYSINYSDVLSYEPINMEVVDVALRADPQTSQLYFDGTSTKEMTVDVTIPPGVTGLIITAQDYSSVKVGDTSLQGNNNGVYTYSCASSETEQMVSFTFTLNTNVSYNDDQTSQITFSDAAQGSLVEEASISITLKKTPVVQLTIQQQPQLTNSTLYYSETSREEFTMDVNVPAGVEQLQITAEDFDVSWATGNGVGTGTTYTISDTQNSKTVRLMFTLKEGKSSTDSPSTTITITGSGDYVIVSEPLTTDIILEESAAPAEGSINWQGAVMMDYENQHMTKIPIFYSDLEDLLPGSKIQVDYTTNGGWVRIYYPYALNGAENQWDDVTDNTDELNDKELVLTETILSNIKNHSGASAYNHAGVGLVLQGSSNSVLTKITIVPAKERIEANITNGSTLYYDSNDAQTVTVQTTIPAGVTTLNIDASNFDSVSADGGYKVNGNATDDYSVSLEAEGEKQINFTFTLDKSKYLEETGSTSTTITFSDGSGNATEAPVIVNLVETPVVTFTQSADMINLNGYLDVTMNLTGTFNGNVSLTIRAPGFTVAAHNNVSLSNSGDVWTYNGSLTTLRFIPTSVDGKTINIDGSGENVKVEGAVINVIINETTTEVIYTHTKNDNYHVFSITSGGDGMASEFEVMWYSSMGYGDWQAAKTNCSGFGDFRMPTYEEMRFLVSVDSECGLELETTFNDWWISTENSYYSISDDSYYTSTSPRDSQVRCVRTIAE